MHFQSFCSKIFLLRIISVSKGDSFLQTSLSIHYNFCIYFFVEPRRDNNRKYQMGLSFKMESDLLVRPYNHHHLQIYGFLCTTISIGEAFKTNFQNINSTLTFYRKNLVSAFIPLLTRHQVCLVYGRLRSENHLQNDECQIT